MISSIQQKIRRFLKAFSAVRRFYGWSQAFSYLISSVAMKFHIHLPLKYQYLFPQEDSHPLCSRFGSSDSEVYDQVFDDQQYSPATNISNPKLIIDCGANVGYASVYFLNQFPEAHVILVEPDSGNVAMCRKNLAGYDSSRYQIHQSAVWTHDADLVVRRDVQDGRAWSFQVREKQPGETPDVTAHGILCFLEKSGFQEIDLLKIDIERSETVIFAKDYASWLDKTHNLAIELHDEECERIFFKAMEDYDYEMEKYSETTCCRNIRRKTELICQETHQGKKTL